MWNQIICHLLTMFSISCALMSQYILNSCRSLNTATSARVKLRSSMVEKMYLAGFKRIYKAQPINHLLYKAALGVEKPLLWLKWPNRYQIKITNKHKSSDNILIIKLKTKVTYVLDAPHHIIHTLFYIVILL